MIYIEQHFLYDLSVMGSINDIRKQITISSEIDSDHSRPPFRRIPVTIEFTFDVVVLVLMRVTRLSHSVTLNPILLTHVAGFERAIPLNRGV